MLFGGCADPDYYRPWGAQGAHTTCLSAGVGSTLSALPVQLVAAWYALPLRAPRCPWRSGIADRGRAGLRWS
ncbi:MAG: hypothetical protein U1F06_09370 [Steroidobacteraceae bacterium]